MNHLNQKVHHRAKTKRRKRERRIVKGDLVPKVVKKGRVKIKDLKRMIEEAGAKEKIEKTGTEIVIGIEIAREESRRARKRVKIDKEVVKKEKTSPRKEEVE